MNYPQGHHGHLSVGVVFVGFIVDDLCCSEVDESAFDDVFVGMIETYERTTNNLCQ